MGKSSFAPMIIEQNMGILIHGDGSFAGQAIVYETLHLGAFPY
jgi:2-oxoglutarate dehydrogenase complex dehydrogenase (E1) component-like enzyme